MKRLMIAVLTALAVITIGVTAFAHGTGYSGGGHMQGYGGYMMDQAYGGHMMDQGYGRHERGSGGPGYGNDQKFLDETAQIRKELHQKKFEYFEITRDPDTSRETVVKLERELYDLQDKISEKTPRTAYGGTVSRGHCW